MKEEILKRNIWCAVNTKGGIGKSIVSNLVLPLIVDSLKEIKIYEMDDNNDSGVVYKDSENIKRQTLQIADSSSVISGDVMVQKLINNNDIQTIIDCGGSNDSNAVIDFLNDNEIKDIIYFIPVNDDVEQFINVHKMVKKIREFDNDSLIFIIFNKASTDKSLYPKREDFYTGFFGDKEYGIKANYPSIKNLINGYFFINDYKELKMVKSYYGKTLKELLPQANFMIDNIDSLKNQWAEKYKSGELTQEQIISNNSQYKFFKKIVTICNEISQEFNNIKH